MAERLKAAVLKTVEGLRPPRVRIPASPPIITRILKLINVMLVDDHDLVRTGIKRLLSERSDIIVVGEADSGEQALRLAREMKPDVILMDVKMPGIGGLEATRRLLRVDDSIKIIAVTSCDEEPFPSRLLQAGAAGYLTKGCSIDEIVSAIHRVHAGQHYISPEIAQKLVMKNMGEDDASPFEKLSEREIQIMLMITSGLKVNAISEKLCLSSKTVNNYRYRLFEKLKINSDVELTHLAMRHGMLDRDMLPDDPQ